MHNLSEGYDAIIKFLHNIKTRVIIIAPGVRLGHLPRQATLTEGFVRYF
jgi:hypothetical protein